jgi:acyl carrier protein
MSALIDVIAAYVRRESGYEGEIDPNTDLLASQILDSYSVVSLAVFVQEEFGVEFEESDLVRENLSRLSSIAALVDRKRTGAG